MLTVAVVVRFARLPPPQLETLVRTIDRLPGVVEVRLVCNGVAASEVAEGIARSNRYQAGFRVLRSYGGGGANRSPAAETISDIIEPAAGTERQLAWSCLLSPWPADALFVAASALMNRPRTLTWTAERMALDQGIPVVRVGYAGGTEIRHAGSGKVDLW